MSKKKNKQDISPEMTMKVFSALVQRAQLMSRLGQQYDGDRDLYEALGYVLNPDYKDFAAQYSRQDIAKAIIDRPANATWKGGVTLIETDDSKETKLEKAWVDLSDRLKLVSKFHRLDKLTGLGEFGVLLLGLDDVKTTTDWTKPVSGARQLIYVKPLSQGSAQISTWDRNTSSPRYGLPETYTISISNNEDTVTNVTVHHSRIIHIVDSIMESETEGIPRLKPVYNRLMDIEKIVGGSGEMFWRGARPGYTAKVDKEYQMTTETEDGLQSQLNEYEHNLRRFLALEGVDINAIASQVSDPSNHLDVQIQMISAETGIPKRVLTGSEMGELASSQDSDNWLSLIEDRRTLFAEPNIVRPFVDRMIEYQILPRPVKKYSVEWLPLFEKSDKDKAEVGKTRATALKEYTTNPIAGSVVPEDAFFELFLGLNDSEIEIIKTMREQEVIDEGEAFEE